MVGSTAVYQLPKVCRGRSLLVGRVTEGMAICGMDHAFNRVERLSPFALPGDASKLPVRGRGPAFFAASPGTP